MVFRMFVEPFMQNLLLRLEVLSQLLFPSSLATTLLHTGKVQNKFKGAVHTWIEFFKLLD